MGRARRRGPRAVGHGPGEVGKPLPRPLSGTPEDLPQSAFAPLPVPFRAEAHPRALGVGRWSGPAPSDPARRGRCRARGRSPPASASASATSAGGKPSSAG